MPPSPSQTYDVRQKTRMAVMTKSVRLRLTYAKLKVDRGWTRQTLSEVENLHYRATKAATSKQHIFRQSQSQSQSQPHAQTPRLGSPLRTATSPRIRPVSPINPTTASALASAVRSPTRPHPPATTTTTTTTTTPPARHAVATSPTLNMSNPPRTYDDFWASLKGSPSSPSKSKVASMFADRRDDED